MKQVLLISLLTIYSITAIGQNKRTERILAKAGLPTPPTQSESKEYKEAVTLAKSALIELQKGNVVEAEQLIYKSIETYPTVAVFDYALYKGELPDVAGANALMLKAYERVKDFPGDKVEMFEPYPSTMQDGKMVAIVRAYAKDRATYYFAQKMFETNKVFGVRKYLMQALELATTIQLAPQEGFDGEKMMQLGLKMEYANYTNDFESAFKAIAEKANDPYYPEFTRQTFNMTLYLGQKNYAKVLQMVDELYSKKPEYKDAYHAWNFFVNTQLGNTVEAKKHYNSYNNALKESNGTYYYLGLLDLHEGNYDSAIKNFLTSIKLRGSKGLDVYMLVPKWEVYTGLADAYAGLKEFEKAKDNYNIALLYYPEYEAAITGLKQLDKNYIAQTTTDKTAPLIEIFQPALSRGLKVTATADKLFIKGKATDASGIKEVFANGTKLFSQPSGDFWGEINVAAGLNKVDIIAADMAGNKGTKVLEIVQSSVVAANTEQIVPIAEKPGKNYAVFIAAQNYSDSQIPSLENPIADAVKLKLILKNQYAFDAENIISLFNPETNDVRRQLLELTNLLQPEDHLVIFYAGHGIWVDKEKKGYWLMTDAKRNDTKTWLPNREVLDLIAKLPARNTLLITDACFSGSVFKTRSVSSTTPPVVKKLTESISRVAITSGNDTEVPDESVFMKYLVKALNENKDKYLTAQKMFINQILEAVMSETQTQPRYGTLELAGHVGGDFIFQKK